MAQQMFDACSLGDHRQMQHKTSRYRSWQENAKAIAVRASAGAFHALIYTKLLLLRRLAGWLTKRFRRDLLAPWCARSLGAYGSGDANCSLAFG
jgi:hypothetical protein